MQRFDVRSIPRPGAALRTLTRGVRTRLRLSWLALTTGLALLSACGSCRHDDNPPVDRCGSDGSVGSGSGSGSARDAGTDAGAPAPSLVLAFAAQDTTTNCGGFATGGAGITSNALTLTQGGLCEPATFRRIRRGVEVGAYTVNCSAPPQAACLETDESLVLPDLPSGEYVVHVRANIAGVPCWIDDETIVAPPAGQTLTRTLRLAHQRTPGCAPPSAAISPAPRTP